MDAIVIVLYWKILQNLPKNTDGERERDLKLFSEEEEDNLSYAGDPISEINSHYDDLNEDN